MSSSGGAPPLAATHGVFHDPAWFERELAACYERSWFFLGPSDALAAGPLVCPAGRWRYRCEAAPGAPPEQARVVREDRPERLLPLGRVGRYLFAAGTHEPAQDLVSYLGPQAEVLRELGEPRLLFEAYEETHANWKLVVSGAIEDYHVPHVHGQTIDPHRREPAPPRLHPGGHSSYATEAPLSGGLALLHRLLTGGPPAQAVFQNHLVFPNLLTIRLWGLVHVTRFVPLGLGRSQRWTRIYTEGPRGPGLSALCRPALRGAIERGFRRAFAEDRAVVEAAQRGTGYVRGRRRGAPHAEEARVEHLLSEVARRVDALGADPREDPA